MRKLWQGKKDRTRSFSIPPYKARHEAFIDVSLILNDTEVSSKFPHSVDDIHN